MPPSAPFHVSTMIESRSGISVPPTEINHSLHHGDIAYDMISECLGARFSTRMSLWQRFAVIEVLRECS